MHFMTIAFICVFVNLCITAFWFSPRMFGEIWAKDADLDLQKFKSSNGKILVFTAFCYLATSLTMYSIIQWAGVETVSDGAMIGFLVGIGILSMGIMIPYLWESRPPRLFMMTAICQVMNLSATGALTSYLV